MPCSDGLPGVRTEYIEREHDGKMAARLCAIMHVLEDSRLLGQVLNDVNWQEAGTSRGGLENWWKEHKRLDQQRKAWERQEKERKRAKESALKKLSLAERKALGL